MAYSILDRILAYELTHSMPSQYRRRRSFFKYAAPDTVLAILRNRTVRFSSPLSFNDPFDIQSGLHFEFEVDLLPRKVLDRIYELATAPTDPPVDRNDPWGKVVLMVREHLPASGFLQERLQRSLVESLAPLLDEIKATQSRYQDHWANLLPGLRVFCVSEECNNLLMWAHYAADHTGAVLEFLSLPEEDNALSVARPVQYVDHPPPFFTETEWLDDVLSVKKFDPRLLNRRYVHYKSRHWAYEKEWRVWYPTLTTPKGLYDDVPIRPSEFVRLYIGCKASAPFIRDVVSLSREGFPNIRLFRGRRSDGAYALEFMEV